MRPISIPHGRSSGFSLIEVLVGVLVLSLGLLGMAGLQVKAMQAQREARLQSLAVQYAREFGELVRGNGAIALQPAAAANPYLMADFRGAMPTPPIDCVRHACDAIALAHWQVHDWQARIADPALGLPRVRVASCMDRSPFDEGTGTPRWACDAGPGAQLFLKIGWMHRSTDASLHGAAARVDVHQGGIGPLIVLPVGAGASA